MSKQVKQTMACGVRLNDMTAARTSEDNQGLEVPSHLPPNTGMMMADITMCDNQQCEMRNTCYRHRATPSHWQSWAIFTPDNGDCQHYIECVPHTRKPETEVERLVSRFNVGAVWLSPMNTYYRVEETNEATGQAVLRMGLSGNYRRIRRQITATKNWTFVAPAMTSELLDSVNGYSQF